MRRRATREVRLSAGVAGVADRAIGGGRPIVIQSMTTAAPSDVAGTVDECVRLHEAGCELTRISTPKVPDAANLAAIRRELRARGIPTPLSADIHFVPAAALEAAKHVEKVRINPGNFADAKAGRLLDFTGASYEAELERVRGTFAPLVDRLRSRGAALRIGTNHGSLSDRILSRYGDTPEGMVESAMEYLRLGRALDYHDMVVSMKSSNPRVMVQAVRRLVAAMNREGFDCPLHLGVTEAGEGEDGRLRSAAGIGALLCDGIGDTIRVSLAEPPEAEIPVARELAALFPFTGFTAGLEAPLMEGRRATKPVGILGGANPVRLFGSDTVDGFEIPVEVRAEDLPGLVTIDPAEGSTGADLLTGLPERAPCWRLVITRPAESLALLRALAPRLADAPLVLSYRHSGKASLPLSAAVALGAPLIEGYGDAVEILPAPGAADAPSRHSLALGILQNSLTRISRVEIIACPSCGRTLFDLPEVTREVKRRFARLKGVKIAVMGCIVNGPGEMADADYGFVGGAPGKISLYRGQSCVTRNIPIAEAYDRLEELIRGDGKWSESAP